MLCWWCAATCVATCALLVVPCAPCSLLLSLSKHHYAENNELSKSVCSTFFLPLLICVQKVWETFSPEQVFECRLRKGSNASRHDNEWRASPSVSAFHVYVFCNMKLRWTNIRNIDSNWACLPASLYTNQETTAWAWVYGKQKSSVSKKEWGSWVFERLLGGFQGVCGHLACLGAFKCVAGSATSRHEFFSPEWDWALFTADVTPHTARRAMGRRSPSVTSHVQLLYILRYMQNKSYHPGHFGTPRMERNPNFKASCGLGPWCILTQSTPVHFAGQIALWQLSCFRSMWSGWSLDLRTGVIFNCGYLWPIYRPHLTLNYVAGWALDWSDRRTFSGPCFRWKRQEATYAGALSSRGTVQPHVQDSLTWHCQYQTTFESYCTPLTAYEVLL